MQASVDWNKDILNGVIKSVVFGIAVTWIAVFEGYDAPPTAEGVSRATTRTVVTSSLAILALDLGVDTVAVTQMTNGGFHALMRERGVRVLTTDVGDRYVLEALRREGAVLGGEQSGHLIYLRGHVTGDGLAAALESRAVCSTSLAPSAARLVLPWRKRATSHASDKDSKMSRSPGTACGARIVASGRPAYS